MGTRKPFYPASLYTMKYLIQSTFMLTLMMPLAASADNEGFSRPTDAIKYRQGLFQVMGTHTQRLGAMAKGDVPFDKQSAQANAALIELLSSQLNHAFPTGSDISPSKAKPEVWQETAAFKSKLNDLQTSATRLNTAVKSADIAAFKAAFSTVSQSCKSCHDTYRNR